MRQCTSYFGYVTLTVLVIAGCAGNSAYIDSRTQRSDPSSQLAHVVTDSGSQNWFVQDFESHIKIVAVDRKEVPINFFHGYPVEVFLEPGRRQLNLKFIDGSFSASGCIMVNVLAGNKYFVEMKEKGMRFNFTAKNTENGELVSEPC